MMVAPRVRDLEIDEDLEFERRQHRVQRVLRLILGMIPLAGVLGLFGSGPLSTRRQGGEGDALSFTYERFARRLAPTQLHLRLAADGAEPGMVHLTINARYLRTLEIEEIAPPPVRVESDSLHVVYAFALPDGSRATNVTLVLRPSSWGTLEGEMGTGRSALHHFTQFVFP